MQSDEIYGSSINDIVFVSKNLNLLLSFRQLRVPIYFCLSYTRIRICVQVCSLEIRIWIFQTIHWFKNHMGTVLKLRRKNFKTISLW
jgi:hypothetical protein